MTPTETVSGHRAAGRTAATRRPLRAVSFLLSISLLSAAVPGFAQEAEIAASGAAPAAEAAAALSDPMPMPDRAMLFAADINQLLVSQPNTGVTEKPPVSGRIQTVLRRALALLGTPYRWGGTTENGFDCSGLVGYVFKTALGIELPRVSREMANSGERIERASLSAGDLVFFSRRGQRVDHVGIYVGDGQFVHAPRTGKDVMVSRLDTGYWSGKFMQARRVPGV